RLLRREDEEVTALVEHRHGQAVAAESSSILRPAALGTRTTTSSRDSHQTRGIARRQVGLRRLDEMRSCFDVLARGGVRRKEESAAPAPHAREQGERWAASAL